MLALNDEKWNSLLGGYRNIYNPISILKKIEEKGNIEAAWVELWNELHHQGDVDVASYASVPQLVRIQKIRMDLGLNFYSLVSTIEIERHHGENPAVPNWLEQEYLDAWTEVAAIAAKEILEAKDQSLTRSALAALSISKGFKKYGQLIGYYDEEELSDLLPDIMGR
jgi:hypothetical protein